MAKTRSFYGIDAEHTLSKASFVQSTEEEHKPIAEKCKKFLVTTGKNIGLSIFILLGLTSEVIKDNLKS